MYELVQHIKLDAEASSINFSNIPQNGTDLLILSSLRQTGTTTVPALIHLNQSSVNFSSIYIQGNGSAITGSTYSSNYAGFVQGSTTTANTFSNNRIYIPNYTGSPVRLNVDGVTENNATEAYQHVLAGRWTGSGGISQITIGAASGNLVAGSSATLYKINRTSAIGAPKAVGGNITYSNGYWVHTFTGSGTFIANEDLSVDSLVVAGGGGGGAAGASGGGGGGGGILAVSTTITKGSYSVTVGAGGTGGSGSANTNTNGFSSTFLTAAPIGGGYGGNSNQQGGTGSSGGGGGGSYSASPGSIAAGLGTSGQGNNGGTGISSSSGGTEAGGGGGGAGAVGVNSSSGAGGAGGDGAIWQDAYYGGGGGGADRTSTNSGGLGGGGTGAGANPGNGTAGTANTGGGGGGGAAGGTGGAGGSGVVIIRYKAD